MRLLITIAVVCALACIAQLLCIEFLYPRTAEYHRPPAPPPMLNKGAYEKKLAEISHITYSTSTPLWPLSATSSSSTKLVVPKRLWPVKTVFPNYGALLPFNRIVAYYGNFLSRGMGVLGQYDPPEMLKRLRAVVKTWEAADPKTPVIPAIDYIAVVAQGDAGRDGMYRARMSDVQIDKAVALAKEVKGIVVLDVQVGLSTLQKEIPELEKYLSMPNVHLAIDPEFAMHNGAKPGTEIGSFDAADVNYTAAYLAGLVKAHHLPPKILIVHRFTNPMVTNSRLIKPLPEVQIIMQMDGWGPASRKISTYQEAIYRQPVQFTGFKLFYKNDLFAPSKAMMTPAEVIELTPSPSFIQYQ